MRDGAYIKRLAADLERWAGAGAITGAQAGSLLDDARARANLSRANPAAIAAGLGAVLFGLGLITFIAANWGAMAKSARLLSALALMWLIFAGAIAALARKANWIGQALVLAGALSIGAAISLVGQTYHIEGDAAGLFFLWMLGALGAAIAFRSTPALILYVIIAFLWFASGREQIEFLFDNGRTAPFDWRNYGLAYLPFWFAGAFLARRVDSGAGLHLSGLAALAWLFSLFSDAIWAGAHRSWMIAGLFLAAAGALIGLIAEYARARHGERAAGVVLAWCAAAAFIGLLIAQFDVWDEKVLLSQMGSAAALLALAVWAISWGDEPGRRGVRGFAVALFAFECFYIYTVLFGGLQNTALFLLGGGALLFALAFGLTRLRRKPAPAGGAP
ncbi:MAG TPA: DUF2157 domain-containing protein [Caulobacterales bacterium]|nr:DUF2157 domain-containing protein [Caulobacterales bacterium]